MTRWERQKAGHYRLIHTDRIKAHEPGVTAEVAKAADGKWYMEYLDKTRGWTLIRCKSLHNAKAVAKERCKQ